jgi:hypothetical protein
LVRQLALTLLTILIPMGMDMVHEDLLHPLRLTASSGVLGSLAKVLPTVESAMSNASRQTRLSKLPAVKVTSLTRP